MLAGSLLLYRVDGFAVNPSRGGGFVSSTTSALKRSPLSAATKQTEEALRDNLAKRNEDLSEVIMVVVQETLWDVDVVRIRYIGLLFFRATFWLGCLSDLCMTVLLVHCSSGPFVPHLGRKSSLFPTFGGPNDGTLL